MERVYRRECDRFAGGEKRFVTVSRLEVENSRLRAVGKQSRFVCCLFRQAEEGAKVPPRTGQSLAAGVMSVLETRRSIRRARAGVCGLGMDGG